MEEQGEIMATLWQSGSGSPGAPGLHPDVDAFLSSLAVDTRILKEDIECSMAHAQMLGRQGILPEMEAARLSSTLEAMLAEARAGRLAVDPSSEDVHSFIESELVRRLGETGKAVHAGRSRNDQVAVAFRLYTKRAYGRTVAALIDAMKSVLAMASAHVETIMPGYTHLQRAQPVSLAHHLLAWAAAFERDLGRLRDGMARADECPLGAGALAGSGLPTDREFVAQKLGFARPTRNTMDSVADRDFCVEFASACATIMTHLSRASEDIALWVSTEYSFMKLGDAASTGSSIMPQKRNPDPAELIRGKSARVFGGLQTLLVMQKGLAYAYNRDLQEDKEIFFDIEASTIGSLRAFAILVSALEPDVERMRSAVRDGFLEATDVAEYLVREGLPFRTAYQVAKSIVQRCIALGKRLPELTQAEIDVSLGGVPELCLDAARLGAYLDPVACVLRRDQPGGPAPARTREEIDRLSALVRSLEASPLQHAAPTA
jgi:argininosuccinate lyase